MTERILTLSLRQYLSSKPRNKRARKAVKYVRDRIAHYNSLEPAAVRLSMELNSLIMKKYARHMSPVKLVVNVEKGIAYAKDFSQSVEKKAAEPAKATAGAKAASAAPLAKAAQPAATAAAPVKGQKQQPRSDSRASGAASAKGGLVP